MIRDISVVIPAYNEEQNIMQAIDCVIHALQGYLDDYEIIAVNDGSADRTGELLEEKAKENPRIRVVHNPRNGGFGNAFKKGVENASKVYVTGFPGDNDASALSLRDLIREIGDADLVCSYMQEIKGRPWIRNVLSQSTVWAMNILFGLNLKYYNGMLLAKRSCLLSVSVKANGLLAVAEYLIRMIKSGCRYKEIGFVHIGRKEGHTKAFRWKNIYDAFKTVIMLRIELWGC
jgi:glycosyltransferase involved in cell wall biosynthesis